MNKFEIMSGNEVNLNCNFRACKISGCLGIIDLQSRSNLMPELYGRYSALVLELSPALRPKARDLARSLNVGNSFSSGTWNRRAMIDIEIV